MIGWMFASFFFCLASIGWWRSEQYRRLSLKNAQLAEDALATLVRVAAEKQQFLTYEQLVKRVARDTQATRSSLKVH